MAGAVGAAGTIGPPAVAALLAVGLVAVGALGAAGDRPRPGGRALAVGLAAHLHHRLSIAIRLAVVGSVFPCRPATLRISAMSLVYDQPLSSRAVRSLAPIGGSAMRSCSSRYFNGSSYQPSLTVGP